jgi:hypothetical protein
MLFGWMVVICVMANDAPSQVDVAPQIKRLSAVPMAATVGFSLEEFASNCKPVFVDILAVASSVESSVSTKNGRPPKAIELLLRTEAPTHRDVELGIGVVNVDLSCESAARVTDAATVFIAEDT